MSISFRMYPGCHEHFAWFLWCLWNSVDVFVLTIHLIRVKLQTLSHLWWAGPQLSSFSLSFKRLWVCPLCVWSAIIQRLGQSLYIKFKAFLLWYSPFWDFLPHFAVAVADPDCVLWFLSKKTAGFCQFSCPPPWCDCSLPWALCIRNRKLTQNRCFLQSFHSSPKSPNFCSLSRAFR